MKRTINPRRPWGAASSEVDYDSLTQQGWGPWNRDRKGESPPGIREEEFDGSEFSDSSSGSDASDNDDEIATDASTFASDMLRQSEERSLEVYGENGTRGYEDFPELYRERKRCNLTVSL